MKLLTGQCTRFAPCRMNNPPAAMKTAPKT